MLRENCSQKDVPNIDIVFSSCQVLVGFTVAFVLGRGIRFRVVICKSRCQSDKPGYLFASKAGGGGNVCVPFTALSLNAANFFARADFAGAMILVMRRCSLEEPGKFRPRKNAH